MSRRINKGQESLISPGNINNEISMFPRQCIQMIGFGDPLTFSPAFSVQGETSLQLLDGL